MTPAVERLRAAGLRVTSARVAVFDVLDEAQGTADHHLTVAAVAKAARDRLGSVSTQAVYDCLDVLAHAGLARRIEPAGMPAQYEARVGEDHHHLVCRGCGSTVDVECVDATAPCLVPHLPGPGGGPSSGSGFVVDEVEVTFWGWCASCASPLGQHTGAQHTEAPPTRGPS